MRAMAALLALAVILVASAGPAAAWSVERDGKVQEVQSRRFDGVDYLAAGKLAAAFGGMLREDRGSGNFVMEIGTARVVLSGREGLVSVDGKIFALAHPNRTDDGQLWVGTDFVEKIIVPSYPRAIRRSGKTFLVGNLPPVAVTLRSSSDAVGTRVVLEFSHPVPFEHEAGAEGARVRVPGVPLTVSGMPAPVDGDDVNAVWYDEEVGGAGGTFRVEAGPTFGGVRVSQLSDPFRIVLDFDRRGTGRISSPPPPPDVPGGARARGIRTVVLDAGHGGNESGAEGPTGLFEKDVVLDIVERVARLLRRRLGVSVVLTRDSDTVISLDERAGIANNKEGDLFVSVHANASRGRSAAGAETYYLAMEASDAESESLAARENRSGGGSRTAAGSDLEMVLWDMAQSEYRIESFQLAETIQRELNELLGTRDRGVRQAPFRVLLGVRMPAVLVEVAFITNPEEERQLRTNEFRDRIAEAIAASIEQYKTSYEARIGQGAPTPRPAGSGGSP